MIRFLELLLLFLLLYCCSSLSSLSSSLPFGGTTDAAANRLAIRARDAGGASPTDLSRLVEELARCLDTYPLYGGDLLASIEAAEAIAGHFSRLRDVRSLVAMELCGHLTRVLSTMLQPDATEAWDDLSHVGRRTLAKRLLLAAETSATTLPMATTLPEPAGAAVTTERIREQRTTFSFLRAAAQPILFMANLIGPANFASACGPARWQQRLFGPQPAAFDALVFLPARQTDGRRISPVFSADPATSDDNGGGGRPPRICWGRVPQEKEKEREREERGHEKLRKREKSARVASLSPVAQ